MNSSSERDEAIRQASQAAQCRDWHNAVRWWDIVRSQASGYLAAYTGAAYALRKLGRFDDAERLLSGAAERFPDHQQVVIASAWLANARRDWPTAIMRWTSARQRFPENPTIYVGSIAALQEAGRADEAHVLLPAAFNVLDRAKQRGLDAIECLRLEMSLAKASLDWLEVRRCAEALIACEPSSSAETFLALATACWHLGAVDAAGRAAETAIAADPTLTAAILVAVRVATARGDADEAIKFYRRLTELHPETPRWRMQLVQLFNRTGRIDEALRELSTIAQQWPDDRKVREFIKIFGPGTELSHQLPAASDLKGDAQSDVFQTLEARAPAGAQRRRPVIVPMPDLDMQVAGLAGADTAVLVFTGTIDSVGMPLAIFDHYMAALDVVTVYLKDFTRLSFLSGIRSLSEGYPGTIAVLRKFLTDRGIRRLSTIGNCDGSFAAVRYGVELGAAHIVAVNPTTHFPLPGIEDMRNFKRRRLVENVASPMLDLKTFLADREFSGRIELFFGAEDARGISHASRLVDVADVRLHPLEGHRQHCAMVRLALKSDFVETLHAALGLSAAAEDG